LLRRITSREGRAYGWGLADQALSSLTNFLLGILVARSLSPASFGIFSIAFATYIFALGVSRALSIEPLVIRYSTATPSSWRRAVAGATGMAGCVGIAFGLGCMIFGLAVGGRTTAPFVALGLMMPGLLVQDSWRGAFFAAQRGNLSFLNDLTWTVALLIGFGAYLGSGRSSVGGLVFIWGFSAMLAGVLSAAIGGVLPRLKWAWKWWQEHRDLSSRFVGEFITLQGSGQVSLYGIAAIAGFAATGALRAAHIILGPVNILRIGLATVSVPEGARVLAAQGIGGLRKQSLVISLVLGVVAFAWGTVLLLLPDSVGTAILRENWGPARTVLVPMIIFNVAGAASVGASSGLRVLAAAKQSLQARGFTSILELSLALSGAAVGGAVGAAWGGATAFLAGLGLWWWYFRKAIADSLRTRAQET
jgi:O-antigen/teichoic acid export membrane protein